MAYRVVNTFRTPNGRYVRPGLKGQDNFFEPSSQSDAERLVKAKVLEYIEDAEQVIEEPIEKQADAPVRKLTGKRKKGG